MITYTIKHFSELSLEELYDVIQLRLEVFAVEQNCPYQDCDDKDQNAFHLMGRDQVGKLCCYCRLLGKGTSYQEYASIGRVITDQVVRGSGEGRKMMVCALNEMKRLFPKQKIKISAQTYISNFYASLGFHAVGEEYMEDNIPHIGMIFQ